MNDYGKRNEGNIMFWRIASGHMVRGAKQDTPDAVAVVNPQGGVSYQLHDDYLDGRIIGFDERIVEFGNLRRKMLVVLVLGASGTMHRVEIKRGDQYWSNFLKRLPNVDLSKPVRLWPYMIEDDGKKNIGVSIKQGGQKVLQAFTRENPGNLPNPVEEIDDNTGEIRLNWSMHNRYLEDVVLEDAKKRLVALGPVADPQEAVGAAPVDVVPTEGDENDDMPF